MDRWKSRGGKSQREEKSREEKKKEDQRRERLRRKKMQVREKVEKLRNTVFFQWFVAPEGRKVGSLKRRVRSHLAGWEIKNCTPLWREVRFEVKMYKTRQLRSTVRNWDVEKSARRCGAQQISKSKCTKHLSVGPFLEVEMLKKRTALWREAHSEVKMPKAPHVCATFGRWSVVLCGRGKGFLHLVKSEKNMRVFVAFPKTMADVGHLMRICKDAFRLAGAVQETF